MTYRMRCQPFFLLKNEAKCIKQPLSKQRQAVQFYLDKYADPEIEFESHIVWSSNEADAIREEVEKKSI